MRRRLTRTRVAAVVLIVAIGLFNFHPPHFLIESGPAGSTGSYVLELVLLADLLVAVVAAVGIARDTRWGWLLGVMIACLGIALYLLQETVGLPGLPKAWLEPSRILTAAIETIFLVIAGHRLGPTHR